MKMNIYTNTELNLSEMERISGGVSKDTLLEKGGKGMAGCAIGAAGGTFFPDVGTFAGALIGSAVGYLAGITTAFIEG